MLGRLTAAEQKTAQLEAKNKELQAALDKKLSGVYTGPSATVRDTPPPEESLTEEESEEMRMSALAACAAFAIGCVGMTQEAAAQYYGGEGAYAGASAGAYVGGGYPPRPYGYRAPPSRIIGRPGRGYTRTVEHPFESGPPGYRCLVETGERANPGNGYCR